MPNFTAQGSVTIRKRPENGEPSVSYWIVPSVSSIKRTNSGVLIPASVSATKMKAVGGEAPAITTDYALVCMEYNSSGALVRRTALQNGMSIAPVNVTVRLNFHILPNASSLPTSAIATTSVSIVDDGEDGVGSYVMDLDNENINIGLTAIDDSLYPAAGYNVGESGIYVAGGSGSEATITKVELIDGDGNTLCTATSSSQGTWNNTALGISSLVLKTNKIKVTFSTTKAHSSAERIELRLKGTIAVNDSVGSRNIEAYKVLSIMFQPPGADGVSPTVYELQPSVRSVVVAENGTRRPSSVTCKAIKHFGTQYSEVTDLAAEGLTLQASINGAAATNSADANVSSATSLKWILKKGEVIIDEEEIAFVNDGKTGNPGTSPIYLDLTNENVSVPCTSAGTPIGGVNIQSTATLHSGSTLVGSGITWNRNVSNCTATINNSGLVTVTSISADSAYVDVMATYKGITYTVRLTISKIRGGANGTSPIIYSIEPDVNVIHKDGDGTLSTQKLICKQYKQIGNGARTECSDKLLTYTRINTSGTTQAVYPEGGVDIRSDTELVQFALVESMSDNTILDKETVYVVSDGGRGSNAVTLCITPSSIAFNSESQKTSKVDIFMMDGADKKVPTSVSVKFSNGRAFNPGTQMSLASYTLSQQGSQYQMVFTFGAGSTFEHQLIIECVYGGVTYAGYLNVTRVRNGNSGPAGLIYRKTEWQPNTEYHNDTALLGTQDLCFLDVVYKTTNGQVTGVWECMTTHTSDAENDPNAEEFYSGVSQHWRECHLLTSPIYTSLILAQGSVIAFMQGNQLKIYDTLGNLKAGVSAATGDYPIFYANPQKYPTDVTIYIATNNNSSQTQEINSWVSATALNSTTNKVTVQSGHYLHFKFAVSYSDGSVDESQRRIAQWQNTGSSAIAFTSQSQLQLSYCSTHNSGDSVEANGKSAVTVPNTSVSNPHLWVKVKVNNGTTVGWFQIGEQVSGVEDITKSMFQVKESGDAVFGMPHGARLHMVAAPNSGLPRIDVYDESGNPTATYDGTRISDSSVLYGAGTQTATITNDPLTATYSDPGTNYQTVIGRRSISFVTDKEARISVPANTLSVYGRSGALAPNGEIVITPARQYIRAQIRVDGVVKHSISADLGYNETAPVNKHKISIPNFSVNVGVGIHTIELVAIYEGFPVGQATAKLSSNMVCVLSSSLLKCRYFANGIAIGSATNNYFMAWNNNEDVMNFVVENANGFGLKVTNEGVKVKRSQSEGWKNIQVV